MLRSALQRLRRWLSSPSEPVGSGAAIPEPAYNEQWEANCEFGCIAAAADRMSEQSSDSRE